MIYIHVPSKKKKKSYVNYKMAGDAQVIKMCDDKNITVQYMCAHTVHCTQRRVRVLVEKRKI